MRKPVLCVQPAGCNQSDSRALYVSALSTPQAAVAHLSLTVPTLIHLNIQKGEVIRSCVSDSFPLRAVLHLGAEQHSVSCFRGNIRKA